ncbi:hypothetical protein BLA29_012750, partial [Euroglyphus maynei]
LIKPRFKPPLNEEDLSSNNILRERANKFIGNKNDSKNLSLSNQFDEYKMIAMDLYRFLRDHNDRVSTDIIVDEFRPRIRTDQSAAFRELLFNMATLETDPVHQQAANNDERNKNVIIKYWKLKDEFRLPI